MGLTRTEMDDIKHEFRVDLDSLEYRGDVEKPEGVIGYSPYAELRGRHEDAH